MFKSIIFIIIFSIFQVDSTDVFADVPMNLTVNIRNFLVFGPAAGDSLVPMEDWLVYGPISMSESIPYLNSFYSSFYASVDGYIIFSPFFTRQIYPYNADLDTRYSGNIFYRRLNSTDLNTIKSEIRLVSSSQFNPSSGFVVTWYQVPLLNVPDNTNYTFQAIVISNRNQTYLIYNYDNQSSPIVWSSATGYVSDYEANLFTPGSSTIMADASNVNVTGKWIFRVQDSINNLGTTTLSVYDLATTTVPADSLATNVLNTLTNQATGVNTRTTLTTTSYSFSQYSLKIRLLYQFNNSLNDPLSSYYIQLQNNFTSFVIFF